MSFRHVELLHQILARNDDGFVLRCPETIFYKYLLTCFICFRYDDIGAAALFELTDDQLLVVKRRVV